MLLDHVTLCSYHVCPGVNLPGFTTLARNYSHVYLQRTGHTVSLVLANLQLQLNKLEKAPGLWTPGFACDPSLLCAGVGLGPCFAAVLLLGTALTSGPSSSLPSHLTTFHSVWFNSLSQPNMLQYPLLRTLNSMSSWKHWMDLSNPSSPLLSIC